MTFLKLEGIPPGDGHLVRGCANNPVLFAAAVYVCESVAVFADLIWAM